MFPYYGRDIWIMDIFLFSWKPSKLDEMDGQGHFTIITTSGNKEYFTEFVPLDKVLMLSNSMLPPSLE